MVSSIATSIIPKEDEPAKVTLTESLDETLEASEETVSSIPTSVFYSRSSAKEVASSSDQDLPTISSSLLNLDRVPEELPDEILAESPEKDKEEDGKAEDEETTGQTLQSETHKMEGQVHSTGQSESPVKSETQKETTTGQTSKNCVVEKTTDKMAPPQDKTDGTKSNLVKTLDTIKPKEVDSEEEQPTLDGNDKDKVEKQREPENTVIEKENTEDESQGQREMAPTTVKTGQPEEKEGARCIVETLKVGEHKRSESASTISDAADNSDSSPTNDSAKCEATIDSGPPAAKAAETRSSNPERMNGETASSVNKKVTSSSDLATKRLQGPIVQPNRTTLLKVLKQQQMTDAKVLGTETPVIVIQLAKKS